MSARSRTTLWVAGALAALYVLWDANQWGGTRATLLATDVMSAAYAAAGGLLCLVTARSVERPYRTSWALMGGACLAWSAGGVAWLVYNIAGVELPFPSLADVGYLLFIPLCLGAILVLPVGVGAGIGRLRNILEGFLATGSILFVSWVFVLGPVFAEHQTSLMARAVSLAYPVGDVAILTLLVSMAGRSRPGTRSSLGLVSLGLGLFLVSDSLFTVLSATGKYGTGQFVADGWAVGFVVLGVAAVRRLEQAGVQPRVHDRRPAVLVPLMPTIVSIPVAMWEEVHHGALEPFLFWDAIVVVGLVVTRQLLALLEVQRLGQDLAHANEDLERRVQERTAELEKAKKAAEEANMAKSTFLATMSHEIRTPLHGIIGTASLLEDKPADADAVATIRQSGEHLLAVLNNILDFSKIEAGRMSLETAPRDPRALAEEWLGLVRANAEAKGLEVRLDVQGQLPEAVLVDGHRLTQVVANLLDNAVKFTSRGSVCLEVAARPGVDGKPALHVAVADTGSGIPAGARANLFQPFVQAEHGTKRSHDGSGLGLAICKRLVEAMDGSIGFQSTPGVGTRFFFQVPALPVALPAPATTRRAVDLKGLKVLLVEDNVVNQKVAQQMLRLVGCEVAIAADGALAVQEVRRQGFDVILMDLHMPNMDGYEATGAIRTLPPPAGRTRIIAMTADALPEDRQRCLDAGMDDYLSKPVRVEDLRLALGRLRAPDAHRSP